MIDQRHGWLGVVLVLAGSLAALACTGQPRTTPDIEAGELGIVAYVDREGCIALVDARSGGQVAEHHCPSATAGVSALAWLDSERIAYSTPELAQIGWRVFDISTRVDGALMPSDAPRVIHAGPVQPYSIHGELLLVDNQGSITLRSDGIDRPLIAVQTADNDRTLPQLLTWSPNGDWALVEYTRDRRLLLVDGESGESVQLAEASEGIVSWFMPEAGVLPHLDFTCGLPNEATFNCSPQLREPVSSANDGSVLLSWLSCTGMTAYEVEIFDPANSGAPALRQITSLTVYRLGADVLSGLPRGTLTWRVRPVIGLERGVWSEHGVLLVGFATSQPGPLPTEPVANLAADAR